MVMRRWMFSLSLGIVLIFCVGCAAKTAVAPKLGVNPVALQSFPKTDLVFNANQFFLWPEGVTAEQVSKVLFLSENKDRLEKELTPLRNRMSELKRELQSVDA